MLVYDYVEGYVHGCRRQCRRHRLRARVDSVEHRSVAYAIGRRLGTAKPRRDENGVHAFPMRRVGVSAGAGTVPASYSDIVDSGDRAFHGADVFGAGAGVYIGEEHDGREEVYDYREGCGAGGGLLSEGGAGVGRGRCAV